MFYGLNSLDIFKQKLKTHLFQKLLVINILPF